jgi:type I restriction enzyme S subunit
MPDPLGRACVFPGSPRPCVTVVDVCIVRAGSASVCPSWLTHFINAPQFRVQVSALQAGSTRKRISKANLCTIPLPVPPPAQQKLISATLDSHFSRLDAATATLDRVQRNLERYRASVLKAAVEGRLVPTEAELARKEGRSYEPASVLLQRILAERRRRWEEAELAKLTAKGKAPKDEKWKAKYPEPVEPEVEGLPGLPEGWCWASLDQLAEIGGGITKNAQRDKLALKRPYLRVANVYADSLRLDDIKEIGLTPDELHRSRLQAGDLLVVEGNGSLDQIGRVAMWCGSIEDCVHQNHLIRVRLGSEMLAKWTLQWMLSLGGRAHIERAASSTSGLHTLSLSKVARLAVPLAPDREQARSMSQLASLLTDHAHTNQAIAIAAQRITRLRQSMLKQAFEGRLVASEAVENSGHSR